MHWTITDRSIPSISISEMFEEKAGQLVGGLGLPPVKVGRVEETWLDKSGCLDEYGLYGLMCHATAF